MASNRYAKKSRGVEMKVLQLNMAKSKLATANLCQLIAEGGVDVALIQEPYTRESKVCGFPRHLKILQNNKDNARVKSAIVVNPMRFDVILNLQLSTNNIIVAHTILNNLDTVIIGCYIEPTSNFQIFLVMLKSRQRLLHGNYSVTGIKTICLDPFLVFYKIGNRKQSLKQLSCRIISKQLQPRKQSIIS